MSEVGRNHTAASQGRQTVVRTECAICGKPGYWGHRFDGDHPAHSYQPAERRYVALDAVVLWLRHIDRLTEIPGAADSMPARNPLWDAANAIEREFGASS